MTAPARPGRPALRRARPWLLLAAVVVLVALLTGRRTGDGTPLDPRSTGPLGARALVLTLEELGATVEIVAGPPGPGADTAVLLADRLDDAGRGAVRRWVAEGGVLVVADPSSDFAPPFERSPAEALNLGDPDRRLAPGCALPALAAVGRIEPGDSVELEVSPPQVGCFPDRDGFYMVAAAEGGGSVVALGGAALFLNANLDEADNAVLAASLLAPRPGTSVAFLDALAPGGGDKDLLDLVSRRVKDGLWQLLVAFGILVLWRSRRLGRPVLEPQPVDVAGSEIVVAVGNLLQRARRRDQAADRLRAELRRVLGDRLGLPRDAPLDVLVTAVGRTGVSPEVVAAALQRRPMETEEDLVRLARSIDAIRQEVTHAR